MQKFYKLVHYTVKITFFFCSSFKFHWFMKLKLTKKKIIVNKKIALIFLFCKTIFFKIIKFNINYLNPFSHSGEISEKKKKKKQSYT
jgi:hypothetical protein